MICMWIQKRRPLMMKINEIIGDAERIGIAGHIRPDGDCIGSCMALYNYLKKNRPDLNVNVHLEYVDPKFGIIDNIDDIDLSDPDDTEYELFIALDTASVDRLGKHAKYFENAKKTFCIDHHKSNLGYADENIVVADASSACEVLFDLLDVDLFDESIAAPMYMGIASDSGVFRFQNTKPRTLRIAAKMMEFGINHNEILEETFYKKSYNQMMITAKIQSNTVLKLDGQVIYGYCTKELMDRYELTSNDLDAVIASIRNVSGVEVAMFAYQIEDNKYKVSLRSKDDVDVSKIAVTFGGGGHKRAAGFDIEGDKDTVIETVLKEIEKEF